MSATYHCPLKTATTETSWENKLFTNRQHYVHCTIFIMPNGDVRRSHSANFFKVTGRIEDEINQRPKNYEKKTIHLQTFSLKHPQVLLWQKCLAQSTRNFLSPETHNQKSNNYLAIKLDRLKDKQVRLKYNKEFLSRCITDGLIPKELELMTEPTIRNHDQYFLDNCYLKLKQFSLSLTKDVAQFCD